MKKFYFTTIYCTFINDLKAQTKYTAIKVKHKQYILIITSGHDAIFNEKSASSR